MKYLLCVTIIYCSFSCRSQYKAARPGEYHNPKLVEDYVLCKCLELGYKKDSINLSEYDASIGILFDLSAFSITNVQKKIIDSFVTAYVDKQIYHLLPPRHPADLGGRTAAMLDCIELYKSKELMKLVKDVRKKKY